MESYPGELLVGVFPLVFCVDATLKQTQNQNKQQEQKSAEVAQAVVGEGGGAPASSLGQQPPHPRRSLFDKFLDALATTNNGGTDVGNTNEYDDDDDEDEDEEDDALLSPSSSPLMRKIEEEQSDNDDEILLSSIVSSSSTAAGRNNTNTNSNHNTHSTPENKASGGRGQRRFSTRSSGRLSSPFPPLKKMSFKNRRSFRRKNEKATTTTGGEGGTRSTTTTTDSHRSGTSSSDYDDNSNKDATTFRIDLPPSFREALQQGQSFFQRVRIVPISTRHGFPPSKDPTGKDNRVMAITGGTNNGTATTGMQDPAHHPTNQQHLSQRLMAATNQRPIDGIVASGWLEKHAAALPSVIIIVTQILHHQINQQGKNQDQDRNQQQQQQDDVLVETISNLKQSLASKRSTQNKQLHIKIVAIVQEGVSSIIADQWSQSISTRLQDKQKQPQRRRRSMVTLIHARELNSDDSTTDGVPAFAVPPPPPPVAPSHPLSSVSNTAALSEHGPVVLALPRLQHQIRNCSLRYYKIQARKVKNKLLRLLKAHYNYRDSSILLPLAIRYYFKIGIYYEFQWKQTKSIQYLVEAYTLLDTYYRYLLQRRDVDVDNIIQQQQQQQDDDDDNDSNHDYADNNHTIDVKSSESGDGSNDERVELSLLARNNKNVVEDTTFPSSSSSSPIPDDMIYQCRAVADWINFKILQSGLVSNTKGGLVAASNQWRRHVVTFCSPRRSFIPPVPFPTNLNQSLSSLCWLDWSYVAQQRIVFSQLLERYPARAVGELGSSSSIDGEDDDVNEVLLRCCPWRTYEVAAEALLKVGHQIKLVTQNGSGDANFLAATITEKKMNNKNRTRYIGGIDNHEGFRPYYQDELKKNHMQQALNCALRGISLYQNDVDHLSNKSRISSNTAVAAYITTRNLIPWSRSGTRLHYLAGGILVGLNRYSEAVPHLEQAVDLCTGWDDLQSTIRRLLIKCYDKQPNLIYGNSCKEEEEKEKTMTSSPSPAVDGNINNNHRRAARTSFLLDTYLNANIHDSKVLVRSLIDLAKLNHHDGCMRWYHDCTDETDPTLPFSFTVTFPCSTHAMAGDKVMANVWLRSNMYFDVIIHELSFVTFFGPISVPTDVDLSRSTTAAAKFNGTHSQEQSPRNVGGIIIRSKEVINFTTNFIIPANWNQTPVDGRTMVGSTISFAKNPRPRTSGISAGAGARFTPDEESVSNTSGSRSRSLRSLGGKPLCCEGIIIIFTPAAVRPSFTTAATVVDDGTNDADINHNIPEITPIELTMMMKERPIQPNAKRTSVDENSYISSAWKRPHNVPMSNGPRCLRLLPTTATMIVTNLTKEFSNGKVLEGTVNRIVLKLKAADNENCANIMIRAKCSSIITTIDGKKKRIGPVEEKDIGSTEKGEDDMENMTNPHVRTPVLVNHGISSSSPPKAGLTDFGYKLPDGWALDGDNGHGGDEYTSVVPTIKAGAFTYAYFDVYRPTVEPIKIEGREEDITQEMIKHSENTTSCCETKVNISLRYHPKKVDDDTEIVDYVSLDHSETLLWSSPISITLSSSYTNDRYPSGNRHPSNNVALANTALRYPAVLGHKELVLIDKEKVLLRGVIQAASSSDGYNVEIDEIQFADNDKGSIDDNNSQYCRFKLINGTAREGNDSSSSSNGGMLYKGESTNPYRVLRTGSKISFAWMTEICMNDIYREERLAVSLGTISIHWQPVPFLLPDDIKMTRNDIDDTSGSILAGHHGPLKLSSSSIISNNRPLSNTNTSCVARFRGPLCYIETAPFEAKMKRLPDSIQIAVPFDLSYTITNKTPMYQEIDMVLHDDDNNALLNNTDHQKQRSLTTNTSTCTNIDITPSSFLIGGQNQQSSVSLGPNESLSFSFTLVPMKVGEISLPSISISSLHYKTWIIHDDKDANDNEQQRRRLIYVLP